MYNALDYLVFTIFASLKKISAVAYAYGVIRREVTYLLTICGITEIAGCANQLNITDVIR